VARVVATAVYNQAVWLLVFAIVNMKLLLVLLLPAVLAKPAPESPAHHHHGACKYRSFGNKGSSLKEVNISKMSPVRLIYWRA
jgi:hypothetical protein